MLPRITAEENLNNALVAAVGSGALSKKDGQKIKTEWIKQARRESVKKRYSKNQAEIIMLQMGIGVQAPKAEKG